MFILICCNCVDTPPSSAGNASVSSERSREPHPASKHICPRSEAACNASGTFVKRLIGLPGETVREKDGFVYIDRKRLNEPYIQSSRRDRESGVWPVAPIM